MNNIYILVDYDNIDRISRSRGLKFIADGIVSRIDDADFNTVTLLTIRLYGGWYRSRNSTTIAQRLSIEIVRDFPTIFMNSTTSRIFKVNVELAYGLLISPSIHFYDTFRIRGFQSDIKSIPPTEKGCIDSNCPTRVIYEFITNGSVANQCCSITPEDILYKGVQKLVDNMISCDVFYLLKKDLKPIVIVTSDEDFWPTIFFAIKSLVKIIHIQTKQNTSTKVIYKNTSNNYYVEKLIWQII